MLKILTSSMVAYKAYSYFDLCNKKSDLEESSNKSSERNAICIMFPDNDSGVKGLVSFH